MRDCENCKHRVMKVEVGKGTPPDHFWGCECWECEFEPTTKDNSEVIAMLELLKAQAHNSGANTFIWDVTLESFNFVITRAIESLEQEPTTKNDVVPRKVVERIIKSPRTQEQMLSMLNSIQSVTPQEPCDKCEVGNPCLYCKHEFEPQESEE